MNPGGLEAAAPVVRLDRVTFGYAEDRPVLRDLTFELRPGQFLAVFGANGAGKSTLCYLLSGVVPHIYGGARRGEVVVDGIDPWDVPMWETGRHVAIVLQDPESQLSMPEVGLELALGPSNFGVPAEEIRRRVERVLPVVRLEGLERQPTHALSGGQKQRVALGAALVMQPRLLLLDEPTSQLDPLGHREVLEALSRLKLRETGQAVIMTTHNWDVQDLADLVLVLDQGRVAAFGPTAAVLAQTELLERAGVQPPPLQRFYDFLRSVAARADAAPGAAAAAAGPAAGDAAAAAEAAGAEPRADAAAEGSAAAAAGGGGARLATAGEVVALALHLLETGALRPRPAGSGAGGAAPAAATAAPAAPAARSAVPVLELRGVTYSYPGAARPAVQDVSLTVHEGECVGIIGQNGSGKSTLVKLVTGLLRPSSGEIRYRGEDLTSLRVAQIAQRIGLVLQNPDYQLFNVSAIEEVRFGLRNLGLPPEEVERRARESLAAVGLDGVADLFPFRLSFGDRRRLAVAAVLAMQPDVLILDEPTTAQDYRGRYLLADLAEELRREGRTVIMISHDMELVAHYASRVVVLWDGCVLTQGPPHEVFAQEELLERTKLRPPQIAPVVRALAPAGVPAEAVSLERLIDALRPAPGDGN